MLASLRQALPSLPIRSSKGDVEAKEEDLVPEEFVQRVLKRKNELNEHLRKNDAALRVHIEDRKKWVSILEKHGCSVLSLKNKVNTHCEFLTVIEYPWSPHEVFSFIRTFEHRTTWDKNVSKHIRVAEICIDKDTDLGSDLTYTRTKPIARGVISARSVFKVILIGFVPIYSFFAVQPDCVMDGMTFVESAVSVEELFDGCPERVDNTQAATMFFGSGGLFEPINGGVCTKAKLCGLCGRLEVEIGFWGAFKLKNIRRGKGCRISYLTLTDPRGWLPHKVVNKVMPNELARYFKLIRDTIASKKVNTMI
eukprot:jgi/Bigna1/66228/fgenesh1_pg.1_\